MKLLTSLLVAKSECTVICLGCSAIIFPQTNLLSLVLLTVFACMTMTAKSENHSVVIVLRSQVYVWILRIGENDLIRLRAPHG